MLALDGITNWNGWPWWGIVLYAIVMIPVVVYAGRLTTRVYNACKQKVSKLFR